jgi:hypothetical protein
MFDADKINADEIKRGLKKAATNAAKQLESVQGQIQQIDDEIKWLEDSPLTLKDAEDNINRFVDQRPELAGIKSFFYQREIACPGPFDVPVDLRGDNKLHVIPEINAAVGSGNADLSNIICALFGAEVKRKLIGMARFAVDSIESGPPLSERPALKAALLKRRHELEVQEEAIISEAEELGLDGFYRRADCNPEIVLLMDDTA